MDVDELFRVLDALASADVQAGITGGWGIDALLGRVTRVHRDLDLGLDAAAVDRAIAALSTLGYAVAVDQRPARLELHGAAGRVDLHPIVRGADGAGIQSGFDGETFLYPAGSLAARGVIAGREVSCGTPELQVRFHLGYNPTAVDRQDMAELAQTFDLALPAPYSA